ncbi:MAG: hypothetical protein WC242_03815 [Candidatus Paceibacterota bacterium]|jgi:hypothetical protein
MERGVGIAIFSIGIFFSLTGSWEVALILGIIGLVYIFIRSREVK